MRFSGSSCSYFMVALARQHCSCSLYNYVSKFISNLLVTDSDVDFCSMDSVSLISFSEFILYILVKCYAIFNT